MDSMMEAMGYKREFRFGLDNDGIDVYSPDDRFPTRFHQTEPHKLRKWLEDKGADEETIAVAMRLLDTGGKE